MTGEGDEDIDGRLREFLDTRKGASEKIVGLGGGYNILMRQTGQDMAARSQAWNYFIEYSNQLKYTNLI